METIRGLILTEAFVFTAGEISCEDGLITGIRELAEADLTEEERDRYLVPGLVDIHSHGCFGHDTCDGDPNGLRSMLAFEKSHGTTSYFPTTMTFDEARLERICTCIGEVAAEEPCLKGIYLEGPFISHEKKGAQNPAYIAPPSAAMVRRLDRASGGRVRFLALAPETEGALECIEECSNPKQMGHKLTLSLAHTTTGYERAMEAFRRGANQVTHLYNAMQPYSHREPGLIGAAMDADEVRVELIADGIHIHPAVVRNTFRYFGPDRVILISDSMEATGMEDGEYSLGGQKVIKKGRQARLEDGTIAGSASCLYDCVISAADMGVPFMEALRSATLTPARAAGIDDRVGSLSVGKQADILVIAKKDYSLRQVIVAGRQIL